MYFQSGIVELDVHGMNKHQAKLYIDSQIKKARGDVYRIRVIHGFHGGTELMKMIRSEYRKHPKVIRVEVGLNNGETDLILRELF